MSTTSRPVPLVATTAEMTATLANLPLIDAVGLDARAARLATRSIKADAKRELIDLAISMVDLTTLEGADTSERVRALCTKAVAPNPSDPTTPATAAVCVYPDLVAVAKEATKGSNVKVAAVATAFPAGRAAMAIKLADVASAVEAGADEIDMVIDRGAFLSGDLVKVFDEIVAVKEACGSAHLKVILETGELVTFDNVNKASHLAMLAGADFIKTSTGKVTTNATVPYALVMLAAVRDFAADHPRAPLIGVKVAGGIRNTKDAIRYLVAINETVGTAYFTPDLFRFGASTLLNDLLSQRTKQSSGLYTRATDFSND